MAEMEITTVIGCKNRCTYCPQDKLIKAYAKRSAIYKMTLDTFKQCLDKIPLNIHIHFSGMAEPWLNPECTRMLLHAHEKGYEVAVYTTAVGMTTSDVEKIQSIPFRIFSVHLPDKEGYSKIETTNSYLETIDAISRSAVQNLEYMTMGTLPSKIQQLLGKRIPKTSMMSRAGNIEEKKDVLIPTKLKGPIRCRSCSDLLNHNVLLPNGDVILCCMDYGMKHILGNLLSVGYASLFNSTEYQKLKRGLEDNSINILCRYCENASTLGEYNLPENKNLSSKVKKYINKLVHQANRLRM